MEIWNLGLRSMGMSISIALRAFGELSTGMTQHIGKVEHLFLAVH